MANARTTIWVMAVVLSIASSPVLALVEFVHGGGYIINYEINDDVWVDFLAPGIKTRVNLLDGGSITYPHNLRAFEDSRINILGGAIRRDLIAVNSSWVRMSGGSIGNWLTAWGSSRVDISGGSTGMLLARDSSHVYMSGGSIGNDLGAYNSSQVTVSGGSIGSNLFAEDSSQVSFSGGSVGTAIGAGGFSQVDISGGSIGQDLRAVSAGILTIHGSDFAVDGAPFGYGELTSILGGSWSYEPYRHLTGTLASGELINNAFYIGHDAKIVLIPAPGAVVLGSIGLGFIGWLRRHKTL